MWNEPPEIGVPYVSRLGKMVKADAAFEAWNSRDIKKMSGALTLRTNPIDRHFLLQTLVAETYRRRNDPKMARVCREVGELHLRELSELLPPLIRDLGVKPRVSTFQHLATLFVENCEYDRAIDVCRTGQKLGLDDGIKGGFASRIARIEKRRAKETR